LALLLCAGSAVARVTLDTTVSKVETTLEASGRVKRELMPADDVVPGEELRYSITFTNESEMVVDAERIVITNPIPEGTRYVAGSAGGDFSRVEYSTDGRIYERTEPTSAGFTPGGVASAAAGQPSQGPQGASAQPLQNLRWTYLRDLQPGEAGAVYFHVRMQ
jgi:uncharacterized repeat protein (TIGR01451 family)